MLRRYGLQTLKGLTENETRIKLAQIENEFRLESNLLAAFFTNVDDDDRPQDYVRAAMQLLHHGEWLFNRRDGRAVGLTYVHYGRRGRFCVLQAVGDADIDSVAEYLFSEKAPYEYFKIKAVVGQGSDFEAAVRDTFHPTGVSIADTLLGGALLNTITYERYRPEWQVTAGEDLDGSTELGRIAPAGGAELQPGGDDGGAASTESSDECAVDALELPAAASVHDESGECEQSGDAGILADRPKLGSTGAEDSDGRIHEHAGKSSDGSAKKPRSSRRKRTVNVLSGA